MRVNVFDGSELALDPAAESAVQVAVYGIALIASEFNGPGGTSTNRHARLVGSGDGGNAGSSSARRFGFTAIVVSGCG